MIPTSVVFVPFPPTGTVGKIHVAGQLDRPHNQFPTVDSIPGAEKRVRRKLVFLFPGGHYVQETGIRRVDSAWPA
jgi:hypothetical protein